MTAAMNHAKTTAPGVDSSASTATLASQDVGLLFVREYYTFLNKKPLRLHAFYNKDSFFVRGDEGESVQTYHGQDEIRQKIEELNFEDCKVLVTQVDSQASANNGILIQVLGEMCVKDGPSQKFSQTFFLAPQPNGYYVLNDIFRFLKDEVDIDYYTCEDDQQQQQQQQQAATMVKEEDVVAPVAVEQPQSQPQQEEKQKRQQIEPASPVVNKEQQQKQQQEQAAKKDQQQKQQQEQPATNKDQQQKQKVDEPSAQKDEPKLDEKKKKHAANGGAPVTTTEKPKQQQTTQKPIVEKTTDTSPTPPAPATPRSWANLAANDSSKWGTQVSESKGSMGATPAASTTTQQQQPTTPVKEQQQPAAPVKEQQQQPTAPVKEQQQQQQQQSNKAQQQRKDEVTNIFVKNVTSAVTEDQLREAFIKFGPVKSLNIVPVRNCAFLDFTTPEACQKALAQHKVTLNSGMVVLAEERRRPNGNYDRRQQQQGNYRRGGGRNNPSGSNKSRPNSGK